MSVSSTDVVIGPGDLRRGDWIEVHGAADQPSRLGLITEVLGSGEHEHYRVRWDEEHESIFFPEPHLRIVRRHPETTGHGNGEAG